LVGPEEDELIFDENSLIRFLLKLVKLWEFCGFLNLSLGLRNLFGILKTSGFLSSPNICSCLKSYSSSGFAVELTSVSLFEFLFQANKTKIRLDLKF